MDGGVVTAQVIEAFAYPRARVEAVLLDELVQAVEAEARRKGRTIPSGSELLSAPIPIDSLAVVEILCVLDPIVGFEVKEEVVKRGGYSSIAEAVHEVATKVKGAWTEYRAKADA
jgi:hypothetical protein